MCSNHRASFGIVLGTNKNSSCFLQTGMPDDCTVIVAHVVGRSADDVMDKDHQ